MPVWHLLYSVQMTWQSPMLLFMSPCFCVRKQSRQKCLPVKSEQLYGMHCHFVMLWLFFKPRCSNRLCMYFCKASFSCILTAAVTDASVTAFMWCRVVKLVCRQLQGKSKVVLVAETHEANWKVNKQTKKESETPHQVLLVIYCAQSRMCTWWERHE